MSLKSGSSMNAQAKGSLTVKTNASAKFQSTRSFTCKSMASMKIQATGSTRISGREVDIKGGAITSVKGAIVQLG